ncbi:hypothetical protein [Anaerosacchariphilus polymeriproducens]|uniref:Uncharacterized protein n=1 Tax=Anaerosacchariphilus polymeriproducens TaxID=1812858 RepID=A0A371ARV8_9FIRM|nr:hypothetical protein [Anaerosacchariphilus polymeriproducens]RDU22210.1 hypothetical protein DWV06_16935 [Anaerosacchariphilus polymeriproducens]
MQKFKNTVIEFELTDESKVTLSLAFILLLKLKNENKGMYEKFNKIIMNGPKDLFDNITILYTAYLCANLEHADKCLTEMQFIESIPDNMNYINEMVQELVAPKKK